MAFTSLTAADLIVMIRDEAEEPTQARIKDERLLEVLSRAQLAALRGNKKRDVPGLGGVGARDTVVSLAADDQEIPRDNEMKTILAIWCWDGTKWQRVTRKEYHEQLTHNTDSGWPVTQYYERDNLIGLMPVPSSTKADSLKIDFLAWSPWLTADTDEIFGGDELFLPHQSILIPWGVAYCKRKQTQLDVMKVHLDLFWEEVEDAGAAMRSSNEDSAAVVQARGFGDQKDAYEPDLSVDCPAGWVDPVDFTP